MATATRRELAYAAGLYVLVTLAFFAQAGKRLQTRLIGVTDGDALEVLWNVWWLKRSLLRGRSPYFCDWLFAPDGSSTVWRTLDPLQSLSIALLDVFLRTELAYNIVVLAAYPIAGIGAYLLCRYVSNDHSASAAGGLVFMASPYMVSKMNGHMNLLYGALLPLFCTAALRATEPDACRRSRYALVIVTAAILLTDISILVLAANVGIAISVWRFWAATDRWQVVRRLWTAFWLPAAIVLPFAAIVFAHMLEYAFVPPVRRGISFAPEPLSYVLPFTPTSIWMPLVDGIGTVDLRTYDLACYLGLLVFPIALAGLWHRRRDPIVRWCIAVLVAFLLISMGPRLQHQREVVTIGGFSIALPFAAWSYVPIVGSIGQTGRYLVISYMMMAVGIACSTEWLQNHLPARRRSFAAFLCGGAVLLDFAFRPLTAPLPQPVRLSSYEGRVLDPRFQSPLSMYHQVNHEKPVVGGYAAGQDRIPPAFRERRQRDPGVACLDRPNAPVPCDRDTVIAALRRLHVTDVLDSPGSWREARYAEYGLRWVSGDSKTSVWSTLEAISRTPAP